MSTLNKDTFSEVIDVTLYKYNSIDLKLWGIICRSSGTKKLDDDSVLVSREDLYKAVHGFFRSEINKFQAVSDVTIHKEGSVQEDQRPLAFLYLCIMRFNSPESFPSEGGIGFPSPFCTVLMLTPYGLTHAFACAETLESHNIFFLKTALTNKIGSTLSF